MASTYLTRTFTSTGNRKKFTTSFWVKKNRIGDVQNPIFSTDLNNSNDTYSMMYFTNDYLVFYSKDNTTTLYLVTNAQYRDVNGWYHIVITFDSAQATASNRVKFYVNGEQITSFDTETYPPQNADNTWFNKPDEHFIGTRSYDNGHYLDGLLSHFHFCDGYAYSASDFGETDSTTGEWKIKTSPSVSYGTTGFFILKDGNSVTDQSGNSNNWTVGGGTLTKTEDNPSNVFATLNPLFPSGNATPFTYSFGNTKISETVGVWQTTTSTLGASSGKYYAEFKCFGNVMFAGVVDLSSTTRGVSGYNAFSSTQVTSYGYGYYNGDGTIRYGGAELNPYGDSYTTNDIIGVALDCDNDKLYFSKNGVWQNSGDPTSGATGTGAVSLNTDDERVWGFALSTEYQVAESNFGNGYFGTTAVSSAGTNASGNGIFEYDVPTGYTALSTKGLNL